MRAQVLVPPLREVEAYMFEQLLRQSWRHENPKSPGARAQVLVPPLRELEAYVFEQLLRQLWRGVLLEAALAGEGGPGASQFWPSSQQKGGGGPKHATREEAAVQRWLQALQVWPRSPRPAHPSPYPPRGV